MSGVEGERDPAYFSRFPLPEGGAGERVRRKQGQRFSRLHSPYSLLLLVWGVGVGAAGCAAGRPSGPGAEDRPARSAASEVPVDAVIPAPEGWRVFQLSARRQAVVPDDARAWDRGVPRAPVWMTLAAPSGPYRPVQVVAGQRGYFHVVDAASSRLCLYDAAASLLSTHPLPPEFTPFSAGRAAVFRGADGAFTFLDYGTGEAWQFADRQTADAGTTRWVPRGKVKLPAGVRDCAQPPGAVELFCRDAAGTPLRFDGALNRVPPRAPGGDHARETAARDHGSSLTPRFEAGMWTFTATAPTETSVRTVLFRHRPADKTWERLEGETDSAGGLPADAGGVPETLQGPAATPDL